MGIAITETRVETTTSPATDSASASYFSASRYDVTATGVEICSTRTARGMAGSPNQIPVAQAMDTHTPTPWVQVTGFRAVTVTPLILHFVTTN